jgi:hypothetical protein
VVLVIVVIMVMVRMMVIVEVAMEVMVIKGKIAPLCLLHMLYMLFHGYGVHVSLMVLCAALMVLQVTVWCYK